MFWFSSKESIIYEIIRNFFFTLEQLFQKKVLLGKKSIKEERYYSDDTFSDYLKCNSSLLLDATTTTLTLKILYTNNSKEN